ncbi:DUF4810 domain-containing protein [Burkholderia sp. Ax-1719]|uniref:DUF4810 domain-containing protein n=1 Tax=Burkholderia sp. Ax-1719 TaxID=2608334 RepID=UPI0014203293|nr:DUF4810 domain-containing protein [Burkholderia sp. Ax-1719]NIE67012.1 DUF4810 domain-containing protein [Burkholderia sp. Ax-1719]
MKHRSNRIRAAALVCLTVAVGALTGGCATQSAPPLYGWDGYQQQVYDYLQGKSTPETQIDALEKSQQQMRSQGQHIPPGFNAHLGALYASQGKAAQAQQALLAEKETFPESSTYMDFLLKNLKK